MRLKKVFLGLAAVALIGSIGGFALARHSWTAATSVIEEIQMRGSLRVGISVFEPWVICNTAGELAGYEIDLAEKLAEDMGVGAEFVLLDWNYALWGLLAEQFDILAGLGITPQRALLVNYSSPHHAFGITIVAHTTLTVTRPEDLDNPSVTIAARRGSPSVDFVERTFLDAGLALFDSDQEMLEAVLGGEVHAAAVYEPVQVKWTAAYPETLYVPFDQTFEKLAGAIGLRKGDLDGVNFFNSWVAANTASGFLPERHHYWFETLEWEDQLAPEATQCQ